MLLAVLLYHNYEPSLQKHGLADLYLTGPETGAVGSNRFHGNGFPVPDPIQSSKEAPL